MFYKYLCLLMLTIILLVADAFAISFAFNCISAKNTIEVVIGIAVILFTLFVNGIVFKQLIQEIYEDATKLLSSGP